MNVPFLDLKAHHQPHREEFRRVIDEVIDRGAFAGGPFVEAFETEFAAYCQTRFAAGVGSGTDALWLALKALGVGEGDEVITAPGTFFATAEAISLAGARPVFVDIREDTYLLDPDKVAQAITPRTKAIIPVHLFGQVADMDPILDLGRERGLAVVEDAAQAHGAEFQGRRAGSLGDIGCFSFYPGKNLGAFGEAGAVVTSDPDLDRRVRMLRDHGQSRKYHHDLIGCNARLDGIQAAVLGVKLRHLEESIEGRQARAQQYLERMKEFSSVVLPQTQPGNRHVWHIFAIRVANREDVMKQLQERGIGCGIHYPIPVHLQEAYRSLGHEPGSFPIAETCAAEFVSLPMFPELTEEQVDCVVESLREILPQEGATRDESLVEA